VRQHNGRILRGYLLKERDRPRVLGYYTLSGSCFERAMLPSKTQQRRIPYINVPSVTLGRLAVDKTLQLSGERRSLRMLCALSPGTGCGRSEYLLMPLTSGQNDFI
jgi:hypothetical protein